MSDEDIEKKAEAYTVALELEFEAWYEKRNIPLLGNEGDKLIKNLAKVAYFTGWNSGFDFIDHYRKGKA